MSTPPRGGQASEAEWYAQWPQRLQVNRVLGGSFGVLMSAGMFAMVFVDSSASIAVWAAGSAVAVGSVGWVILRRGGFRWIGRQAVRVVHHPIYGRGLGVPAEKLTVNLIIVGSAGGAAGMFSLGLVLRRGELALVDGLVIAGALSVLATVFGVVLAFGGLFFVIARPTIGAEIYRTGVLRTVGKFRLLRGGADLFVSWDQVAEIKPQSHTIGVGPGKDTLALLNLIVREPPPVSSRLRDDTDRYVQLPLVFMAVEPNSLLALLRRCLDDASVRELIASGEGHELLAIPSLRTRFRLSRESGTTEPL